MLLEETIDFSNRKLGWMSGFHWGRLNILHPHRYQEIIHADIRKSVLEHIHNRLESSRKFPEHLCLQIFLFVVKIIAAIAGLMIFVGIIVNSEDLLDTGLTILGVVAIIFEIESSLDFCIYKRVRQKVKALLQDINNEIASEGIHLEFRQTKKICCFCIGCWKCCNAPDYEIIDIWAREDYSSRTVREKFLEEDN